MTFWWREVYSPQYFPLNYFDYEYWMNKGKVLKVGLIENGEIKNWCFDCENKTPGIEIDTKNGVMRIAGYMIIELKKMAKLPNGRLPI